jgi:UDP-N-acetylglucosamine--N-acetylmuramyl-(pentapeptide) pyrophosphoryl-undecaprenol N-acetylglucosamine transferase
MRLILTGGGTAGHVYPALSVAEALASSERTDQETPQPAPFELLYVGSENGLERTLVQRSGLDFSGLAVLGGIRGMGLAAIRNVASLIQGFFQSLGLIRRYRPSAILATGGYVCVPVVLAGWLLRVPALIYLPDMEPGWAIRFLAPFARRVAVTVPESARFFGSKKAVVTGYPVRADMVSANRQAGREFFGIQPDDKVILVAGGSRGAQHINQLIGEALPELLQDAIIIHVCGQSHLADAGARFAELPLDLKARYKLYSYLHEMPQALIAADLAISRAGASVLGEYPVAGLPSILIPYAGGHRDQVRNAAYLAQNGAAVVLQDEEIATGMLASTIKTLLQDPARLPAMAQAARALARPNAASDLARELTHLAGSGE